MGRRGECIWSVRPGSSMQAALGEIQEGIDPLPLYYGATLLLPSSSDPSDGDAPGAVAALSLWAQTLGRQSAKN